MRKFLFCCLCLCAAYHAQAQNDTPKKTDKKQVLTISSDEDLAQHEKNIRRACDQQSKADAQQAADELARANAEIDAYIRAIDWDAEAQRAIEGYGNAANEPKDKKNTAKPK